jgi:hypothetical protein
MARGMLEGLRADGVVAFRSPDKVLRALRRGAAVTRDLTDHWNYWEDFPLPLQEVRRKYGIAEA